MTGWLVIVMGPSGCGKSTVGKALAARLSAPFIEGDDLHPPANRAKMQAGKALGDTDRAAWIDTLVSRINGIGGGAVVACSALTPYVQDRLRRECRSQPTFCLLELHEASLSNRVAARSDHFMPASLVASQLAALHVPQDAIRLAATEPVEMIIEAIIAALDES